MTVYHSQLTVPLDLKDTSSWLALFITTSSSFTISLGAHSVDSLLKVITRQHVFSNGVFSCDRLGFCRYSSYVLVCFIFFNIFKNRVFWAIVLGLLTTIYSITYDDYFLPVNNLNQISKYEIFQKPLKYLRLIVLVFYSGLVKYGRLYLHILYAFSLQYITK